MASPASLQLYLSSSNCTRLNDTTKRNQIIQVLDEPIVVPEGYEMHVMLVDAQVPVNWTPLKRYILVRSSLRSRNIMYNGRYLAKIPITVGNGYMNSYINYTQYKHPISDRHVAYIELALVNEDGSDISLGAAYDWSCTLEVEFKKI